MPAQTDNPPPQNEFTDLDGSSIDIRELLHRLGSGAPQTLGFALLGFAVAAIGFILVSPMLPITVSTQVIFSFNGIERGEYPDHSKFQSDDLRAPEIIAGALKSLNLDTSDAVQSQVRSALEIAGIIPSDIVKQREHMRGAGLTPPAYTPDEYIVTLSLPRKYPISFAQREHLLREIVSTFQERFQRTYARLPVDFGNVHDALQGADFPDYVILLEADMKNITEYLAQQTEKAKSFRSSSTNLSFTDLNKQVDLFKQIQLDDVLGLIRINSLTRNREKVMMKIDYALLTLKDQERLALEEEKVAKEYLSKTEARVQSYVVGIKSQVPQQRADAPMLDQGLVDSLLANDSYNFTLRKALDASLKVRGIQSEIAKIEERRKELNGTSSKIELADREVTIKTVEASLQRLLVKYDQLIENIRKTHADYARQQFGNAVRLSDQITTVDKSLARTLILPSAIGGVIGLALGMGSSLIGLSGKARTQR